MEKGKNKEAEDKSITAKDLPLPNNFDVYLPWACAQMGTEYYINIARKQLYEVYDDKSTTRRDRKTKTQQSVNVDGDFDKPKESTSKHDDIETGRPDVIDIYTVYDNNDNLIQLKFHKNRNVPRNLLKIISLIVRFHQHLRTIYINRGLEKFGMNEICKIINCSKITEMVFDNLVIEEANYYLLLENKSPLKYLSLARCNLGDAVVETLTSRLVWPMAASKTLTILNLSSNKITDLGANYLGYALRSNRQISYLNLAGNMITDIGADSILDSLKIFSLTPDEVKNKKIRKIYYYRQTQALMIGIAQVKLDDADTKSLNKKNLKSVPIKKPKLAISVRSTDKESLDRAKTAALALLGPYEDPFSTGNVIFKDDCLHCLGNNIVSCLNLAYNKLNYISVKKVYNVLLEQSKLNRNPKGLINICIEGNNLPKNCEEYMKIDYLITRGLVRKNTLVAPMKKNLARGSTK